MKQLFYFNTFYSYILAPMILFFPSISLQNSYCVFFPSHFTPTSIACSIACVIYSWVLHVFYYPFFLHTRYHIPLLPGSEIHPAPQPTSPTATAVPVPEHSTTTASLPPAVVNVTTTATNNKGHTDHVVTIDQISGKKQQTTTRHVADITDLIAVYQINMCDI